MAGAPRLLERLNDDDREHFETVRALLDAVGQAYEVDDTLVRGLDYYTRTVFEFTSDALGAQSGVGGGGRYDGLIEQIGGPPTPGIGWASGVERILMTAGELAGRAAAAGPVRRLRQARAAGSPRSASPPTSRRAGRGARLELGGRSLKGQLKQADRAGARYVAIFGDEGTALKDMETGEQRTVEPDTVMHHISTRLRCEAAARQRLPRRVGRRARRRAASARPCASRAGCTAAATTAG